MQDVVVKFKRLPHGEGLPLPAYAEPGAAGMDLSAAIDMQIAMRPGARAKVPTGFAIEIPPGFEGQVRGRSGLAARLGVGIVHGVGTIDASFRDNIYVLLVNHGEDFVFINRGDRIAQLVIAPVIRATITEVLELSATERGTGGLGSTGI